MDLEKARAVMMDHLLRTMKTEPILDTPQVVREYLVTKLASLEYEQFVVLFLDARHRLITCDAMFRGTVSQATVYPREIAKEALRQNASAVILAHNHPTENPEPSRADGALTATIVEVLKLVDVRVLDHFVIGGGCVVSLAERGML